MMTEDRLALFELIDQSADDDLVRDMLAFAAGRIMEMEVEARPDRPYFPRAEGTFLASRCSERIETGTGTGTGSDFRTRHGFPHNYDRAIRGPNAAENGRTWSGSLQPQQTRSFHGKSSLPLRRLWSFVG